MIKPYAAKLFLAVLFNFAIVTAFTHFQKVYAQESAPKVSDEAARGLSLYKAGDVQGAINALRERVKAKADDADAWHYLGMIAMKGGDLKSAIQSFQTAVKLRPNFIAARTGLAYSLSLSNKNDEAEREATQILKLNSRSDEAHYILSDVSLKRGDYRKALDEADDALELQPQFRAAQEVKDKALFVVFLRASFPFWQDAQADGKKAVMILQLITGYCCIDLNQRNIQSGDMQQTRRLTDAADIFAMSIKRTPNLPGVSEWREELESLVFWRDYFNPDNHASRMNSSDTKAVDTEARILSKPDPQFNKEDVKKFEQAKVVLRAVFTEKGEVQHIMVLRSLGYELTKKAIEAAHQIRFEPAKKGGATVPEIRQIEYDFKEIASASK